MAEVQKVNGIDYNAFSFYAQRTFPQMKEQDIEALYKAGRALSGEASAYYKDAVADGSISFIEMAGMPIEDRERALIFKVEEKIANDSADGWIQFLLNTPEYEESYKFTENALGVEATQDMLELAVWSARVEQSKVLAKKELSQFGNE